MVPYAVHVVRNLAAKVSVSIGRLEETPNWEYSFGLLKRAGLQPKTVFDIGVARGTPRLYFAFPDDLSFDWTNSGITWLYGGHRKAIQGADPQRCLRITSIGALHQSPTGIVLLDVLLDHGGVPDGIDLAWQPKHYLGAPLPGATVATVNLAHVVAAVVFLAEQTVEQPSDAAVLVGQDVEVGPAQDGSLSETIERASEVSDKPLLAGG
jgi:hypothetical protein